MSWGPEDAKPEFLRPLAGRVASWLGVEAAELKQMLINEYRIGTPLGWHRDSPEFNLVAGVSLGAPCRMRLRPYPAAPRRPGAVARPRAALRLPAVRRRALAMAAQRARDEGIALLDHVPYFGGMKWLLLLFLASTSAAAQPKPRPQCDPSGRQAGSQSETVVLVTAADASTVGVILNRPTSAKHEQSGETLYFGGPVMREVIVALFRADRVPAASAFPVLRDVYLTMHPQNIEQLLAQRAGNYRLYSGFSGWAPGSCKARSARRLVRAAGERGVVFRKDTAGMWQELARKARARVALR